MGYLFPELSLCKVYISQQFIQNKSNIMFSDVCFMLYALKFTTKWYKSAIKGLIVTGKKNSFLKGERVRTEGIKVWQRKIILFNLQFLSLMAIKIIGPCLWKIISVQWSIGFWWRMESLLQQKD